MVEMVVELKKFRVMEAYREIPRLAHGLRPVFHKWRGGEDSKERWRAEHGHQRRREGNTEDRTADIDRYGDGNVQCSPNPTLHARRSTFL